MTLIEAENLLERVMVTAPAKKENEVNSYLAGFVDSLFESNQITSEQRDFLYVVYAG